ncbi:DUF4160 domain-containing protein [Spirosoma litoris]
MPKIAVYQFLTFFAYMFDAVGGEPPHLHVSKTKSRNTRFAKIWLDSLTFAEIGDFTEKELALVNKLAIENQSALLDLFHRVRAGEKIKAITLKIK